MRTTSEVMYILWKSKKYKWSQAEIAKLFGCDVSTVCRKIEPERWRRWEVVMSPRQLRSLYKKLGSIQAVADSLWCGYETVRKKIHEYGIPIKQQGKPKTPH